MILHETFCFLFFMLCVSALESRFVLTVFLLSRIADTTVIFLLVAFSSSLAYMLSVLLPLLCFILFLFMFEFVTKLEVAIVI